MGWIQLIEALQFVNAHVKDFDDIIFDDYIKNNPQFDKELCAQRIEKGQIAADAYSKEREERLNNILKCPKCGSTAVTTGARGFSIVTGFLGAGSTVNKCGYKWKS